MVHDYIRLYISEEAYTFEPVLQDSSVNAQSIVIRRPTSEIELLSSLTSPAKAIDVINVFGIVGIKTLLAGDYVVVISGRRKIGRIADHEIFKVEEFKIFPVPNGSLKQLSAAQAADEKTYLTLLNNHLMSGPFYFSYTYDITQSLQRQSQLDLHLPLWKRADERFFYNFHLQSKFIELASSGQMDLSDFILPLMYGFAEIITSNIKSNPVVFALITRRSNQRGGTRYFSRGIDHDGNVSNFNETEQILLLDPPALTSDIVQGKIKFSYVQTRGSVPVFWAEVNNLRYKPMLRVMENPDTEDAFKKHFDQQISVYGDQYLVNLVNSKGHEVPVKAAYEKLVKSADHPYLHYTYFDFHKECSKMRWDRIDILIDNLQDSLVKQGYFHSDEGNIVRSQSSVVRTNCMDCLDRTNVVQSALGRWILTRQLQYVGILSEGENVKDFAGFEFLFRNVWADNADVVSRAYSGTGALKTDFTRTGKRSIEGALMDFSNSVVRYIKNNYLDGPRQDAYDLFLGKYAVRREFPSPFIDKRPLLIRSVPYVLMFTIAMFIFGILRQLFGTSSMMFNLFWLIATAICLAYIVVNGIQYVNWPRLSPLDDIIFYDEKGKPKKRRGDVDLEKKRID